YFHYIWPFFAVIIFEGLVSNILQYKFKLHRQNWAQFLRFEWRRLKRFIQIFTHVVNCVLQYKLTTWGETIGE
ncbi:MAG TPA: hypothetical protein VLH61_08805, partial [Bacteroidales bacterium]|nr:hypothetical protein [Bacteroidales bacterium]